MTREQIQAILGKYDIRKVDVIFKTELNSFYCYPFTPITLTDEFVTIDDKHNGMTYVPYETIYAVTIVPRTPMGTCY